MRLLLKLAEEAKRALAATQLAEYQIHIESFRGFKNKSVSAEDLELPLFRATFENLIDESIQKTITIA